MRIESSPVEAGFTLVELMMGVVVFMVSAVVLGNHITSNFQAAHSQSDTVFAYTKAQAILSEIQALVDRGDVEAAVDLDILDDGITPRPHLTVMTDEQGNLLSPDHVVSGNTWRDGDWVWSRRLSVRPFAGLDNRNVRYVTVRILKADEDGREHELASLSSVVNSMATASPAIQVFDVYLLAIESVPGWWVFMESIVPFVESAITDLENRNPGFSVRTHWITKAGYGRDSVYRPYINADIDSHEPVHNVYWYPGTMPEGNASSSYYVADLIQARMLVDDVENNGWDADTNPYPYALADYYNHSQRYPKARELDALRTAAARRRADEIRVAHLNGTLIPDELDDMSTESALSVLLEDMISNPADYRHALLVNLHGELLPVPPLRNYSDAARCPEAVPGMRCVTHPEELRTQSPPSIGGEDTSLRLRTYVYKEDPDDPTIADVVPFERSVVLHVFDVDLTDGTGRLAPGVSLESIVGGVPVAGSDEYLRRAAVSYYDSLLPTEEMCYAAFFCETAAGERNYTRIYLFNTPTTCPQVLDTRGLAADRRSRLYGLEYNPSPMSGGVEAFLRDLTTIGTGPKNTARWVLTIPESVWDEARFCDRASPPNFFDPRTVGMEDLELTVHTRFMDLNNSAAADLAGLSPGGSLGFYYEPHNLSETYAWWAQTRDAVPWTERSQFQGDPRHNPYKDLMHGDPDFGDGYNWFFDSMSRTGEDARVDYPGIVRSWDRWNGGPNFDVPRFMELYRNALVGSRAIYTTLYGYSYYFVGMGNEIGYDAANGYPSSIPVNRKPWGDGETTTGFVDNIAGTRCYVRDGDGDYWWGRPWLGELCPDWAYVSHWTAPDLFGNLNGNLPSGTLPSDFLRQDIRSVHEGQTRFRGYGTDMYNAHHTTSTRGCVSFFNNGTATQHFNHHFSSGEGAVVGPGVELARNYGLPIPERAPINRPFSVDTGGNVPPEFDYSPYSTRRFSATLLQQFYDHPSGHTGSGLVQLADPVAERAGWIVINGLAANTASGSDLLGKFCLLSMVQSYFELGDTSLPHRIPQPPRVEIISPTEITELRDPSTITVLIRTEWHRWDKLRYTTTTPWSFAEDERWIDYVVMYSPDNGVSWRNVLDDSPVVPGEKPEDPLQVINDSGIGDEIVSWSVPAVSYPEGGYVLRVEGYRRGTSLHYSRHENRIFIQR
jgi:hypothetical protein